MHEENGFVPVVNGMEVWSIIKHLVMGQSGLVDVNIVVATTDC